MQLPRFLRNYGFLRRGWRNPFNRRETKPNLRPGGWVSVPDKDGGRTRVILDRRGRKRKLF